MSDLHVGHGLFRPELLELAIEEANELEPDLVAVAGDLTMEGYRGEFEECRRFLDRLTCPHVIVAMGNHDARNVGYRHFEDIFGPRDSVHVLDLPEGRAKVVVVDATKPDLDEGEVGREHYLWLDGELRGWDEGPAIVVLHHHILAVPGTPARARSRPRPFRAPARAVRVEHLGRAHHPLRHGVDASRARHDAAFLQRDRDR
jgi:3',5'-cyclic-AMP phosphodiesterase